MVLHERGDLAWLASRVTLLLGIRADGSRPPSSDVTCIATHVGFGLRTIGNQIEAFSLITMRHLQAIMYVLAWPPHWVGQWPVQVCLEIILL